MLILLGTFAIALAGSLLPAVSSEVWLLAAAAVAPRTLLPGLVLAATAGQVLGKSLLYLAGSRAVGAGIRARIIGRRGAALERIESTLRIHPRRTGALIVLSGIAGVPPLYALSLACGVLRTGLARFACAAGAGRLARHALIVALPALVR